MDNALEWVITALGHYHRLEKTQENESALQCLRNAIELLQNEESAQSVSISGYENRYYFENQTHWVAPRIPLNPELRPGFDSTPNDERDALEIEHWWNKPYIVTQHLRLMDRSYSAYVERLKSHDLTADSKEEWTSKIEKHLASWNSAWPSGTRYDVRCLNGGAWDRSSSIGMYATLGDAIRAASELLDN